MISLVVSNTDKRVTSNNGSQIQLSLNLAIVLDPSKNGLPQFVKWMWYIVLRIYLL